MKIRTQFILTMILFCVVLLVILTATLATRHEVERLSEQRELAHRIERGANDLSYLSSAYLLYRESQQRARWNAEFSSISTTLSRLNPEDPEQQALVNNIKANLQRVKAVFADVASGLEGTPRTQGTGDIPAPIQLGWSRMAVQNQGISFDASRLSLMLQDQTDRVTDTRTRLIFALIGLFVGFLLVYYVLTYRRVLRAISDLQAGTRIIGSGNLEYALKPKHDDEVGELSHAINRMTASLREVTASKAAFEKEVGERKQAEGLARDRLAEIEDLYRNAPVGLCALDRELRFFRVNERLAEINGISAAAHLGKTVRELMPELANTVEPEMRRVLETGEPKLDIEIVSETPAQPGVKRSWMEQWLPIRDAQGHVTGLNIVVEETTERKRAEQEIRSLARFPAENPNPVLRLDSGGRILFANQASAALLHHWGKAVGDQAAAPWPAIVRDALTNGSGTMLEVGCGDLTYAVFVAPVREAGYVNLYTSDITERKRAEEQLRRTLAELERSNRDLEQFAYVASHDLQEPLRMVSSYTRLLAQRYQDRLDQDARDFIGFAVDGATRMQRLIQDLLAYSRISSHGADLVLTDTEAVLRNALENLGATIRDTAALVTHDALPAVPADPVQLTQVFQNLVGNALKFRGEAPPRVHVAAALEDEAWVFSVADNGIGIDPQYFDQIFVIFRRLHPGHRYPGTGIGLALCQRIIQRHGGRIWVESAPGLGSTFYFTLRRQEAHTA